MTRVWYFYLVSEKNFSISDSELRGTNGLVKRIINSTKLYFFERGWYSRSEQIMIEGDLNELKNLSSLGFIFTIQISLLFSVKKLDRISSFSEHYSSCRAIMNSFLDFLSCFRVLVEVCKNSSQAKMHEINKISTKFLNIYLYLL